MIRSSLIAGIFCWPGAWPRAAAAAAPPTVGDVTFWQDVAPIYNASACAATRRAASRPSASTTTPTRRRTPRWKSNGPRPAPMPPYFMVHDGSCQSFSGRRDADRQPEGDHRRLGRPAARPRERRSRSRCRPARAGGRGRRDDAAVRAGRAGRTAMAEFDEYRCFPLDPPVAANAFLTGYAVTPGDASIVHHVSRSSSIRRRRARAGARNAAIMQALDDASPDRLGWPCFGGAGRRRGRSRACPSPGRPARASSNTRPAWASRSRRPTSWSSRSTTTWPTPPPPARPTAPPCTCASRTASAASSRSCCPDPASWTSLGNATPDTLPPGQADTPYTLDADGRDLGLDGIPSVDLGGRHAAHARARHPPDDAIGAPGDLACASHLENWDFHWQEFYFYKTPLRSPRTPGAGHLRIRHPRRHGARPPRLGNAQRDVPQRADGRAAAVLIAEATRDPGRGGPSVKPWRARCGSTSPTPCGAG